MPELDDPYDYNLQNVRREIDDKWAEQQEAASRDQQANGMRGLGAGSWTSQLNRFNAGKRDEYMRALESANNLRRQDVVSNLAMRQQAFGEASSYANLSRLQKERQEDISMRQKEQEEGKRRFDAQHQLAQAGQEQQARQFGAQHGLQQEQLRLQGQGQAFSQGMQEKQFERQKKLDDASLRNAAIARQIARRQQNVQNAYEERRITLDEFKTRSRANLDQFEASTKAHDLKAQIEALKGAITKTADPTGIMDQIQTLLGGVAGTAGSMIGAGQGQQAIGADFFKGLNASQQAALGAELSKYMDTRKMANDAKTMGEALARQKALQEAAQKANSKGMLAGILSKLGIAGAGLLGGGGK
jgi:hypothetical protein